MSYEKFFWLHVKKSAGITVRQLMQPYYKRVDRTKKPASFIQSSPEEYNDILNNYRVLLGEYQFKRCLFAVKYLYPDSWDNTLSFAFSREPTQRCISMFYYLYWQGKGALRIKSAIKQSLKTRTLQFNTSYAFDVFLDNIQKTLESDSIYEPLGSHFSTHIVPMWNDVTDFEGNILITKIFRLENLIEGLNQVFEECELEKRLKREERKLNQNSSKGHYKPSKHQISKIESIYSYDFELYENAIRF